MLLHSWTRGLQNCQRSKIWLETVTCGSFATPWAERKALNLVVTIPPQGWNSIFNVVYLDTKYPNLHCAYLVRYFFPNLSSILLQITKLFSIITRLGFKLTVIIKTFTNFRDLMGLVSEIGNRGSSLFAGEPNNKSSNDTIEADLDNTTNIYATVQKVFCGRDLSPDEASGTLLGGSKSQ